MVIQMLSYNMLAVSTCTIQNSRMVGHTSMFTHMYFLDLHIVYSTKCMKLNMPHLRRLNSHWLASICGTEQKLYSLPKQIFHISLTGASSIFLNSMLSYTETCFLTEENMKFIRYCAWMNFMSLTESMPALISYFRCFLFVSVLGRFSSSHSLSCILQLRSVKPS